MGGSVVWMREKSDAQGRCRIKSAPRQGFSVSVQHEGHLPATFGSRATADDPTSFTVTLYDAIQGRVVDPSGKPLAGIQIGGMIARDYDMPLKKGSNLLVMAPLRGCEKPATTDAKGRFLVAPHIRLNSRSGKFRILPRLAVCFADEALRQVFFLRFDEESPRRSYEITLRPGRQVRIPVVHEVTVPSGLLTTWWDLSDLAGASGSEGGAYVMEDLVKPNGPGHAAGEGEWIEACLPEGKYRIRVTSNDPAARVRRVEETTTDLVVPRGEGPLLLPPIRMTAPPWRQFIGQPAPEIDGRDLDTGKPVKLADHHGKVVVLDFWGWWCGPCIGAMPALIEAYDHYKGKPVAIIALHDQSVQSRDAYDRKFTEIKRQIWNNRDLPFQVAVDRPDPELAAGASETGRGITCKRYGIHLFPTTLVIDQEGKVVGKVNVREKGRLDAMIDDLLKKSPNTLGGRSDTTSLVPHP
jgi:thiol-disulfide isomerase/thioredoxin